MRALIVGICPPRPVISPPRGERADWDAMAEEWMGRAAGRLGLCTPGIPLVLKFTEVKIIWRKW